MEVEYMCENGESFELLSQLEQFKIIFDCINDSVYVKDLFGVFLYVNKRKAENSGMRPEDMIGKSDFDFMTKKEANKARQDDLTVLNGQPIIDRVQRITRKNGSEEYVSVTKTPLLVAGEVAGLVGVSRNVTTRKEVEEQILDAILVEVHAIKNINTVIGGFSQSLGDGSVDKCAKYLKKIVDSSNRLDRKCDELYYRTVAIQGGLKAFRRECDLRQDVIDFALAQLVEEIIDNEIIIDDRLGLVPCGAIPLKVDRNLMREVYVVLFHNAIKYAGRGKTISFGYKDMGTDWQFNVFNNGPPIPEEQIETLFKKHTSKEKRNKNSGNGWGLYLIHSVIKAHGGKIEYKTTESGHPNFIFTLPKLEGGQRGK